MTILVLDDGVAEIIEAMLVIAGHKVDIALDGDHALQIYCERGPYDLVLTDWDHPGMGAYELINAITKSHPSQRFGFVTAYPPHQERFSFIKAHPSLQKPFEAEQLLDFVKASAR
jgi:CheY-like chemotaxis protein